MTINKQHKNYILHTTYRITNLMQDRSADKILTKYPSIPQLEVISQISGVWSAVWSFGGFCVIFRWLLVCEICRKFKQGFKNKVHEPKRDPSKQISLHWNFNSLILNCHTWNIPKKYPSWIYKQWKSDWYASWVCFMCDNSELSCWHFNGNSIFPYLLQWVMIYSFGIITDLGIDPNSIPYPALLNSFHLYYCFYNAE